MRAIPACAGRTFLALHAQFNPCRAIPACAGRTPPPAAPVPQLPGPSPRVRGEPLRMHLPDLERAGHPRVCGENPSDLGWTKMSMAGHPRVCGENAKDNATDRITITGPSPRVRGERTMAFGTPPPMPGHPRVCGENLPEQRNLRLARSGHPRVCGENFPKRCQPCPRPAGHPRVCGENCHEGGVGIAQNRAIPACAGRTLSNSLTGPAAYGPSPRVRGERGRVET